MVPDEKLVYPALVPPIRFAFFDTRLNCLSSSSFPIIVYWLVNRDVLYLPPLLWSEGAVILKTFAFLAARLRLLDIFSFKY